MDDIDAAVQAAMAHVLGTPMHRRKVEATIRHVADVARRDALREVLDAPRGDGEARAERLLAEAEEAVRRDA